MFNLDRVESWWQGARSSLWYLPSIFALAAVVLGYVMPEFDSRSVEQIAERRDWLFSGSPSAARVILSTIAGSLITVITLLFSITIIALQQASTQFTPRVFRHFTSDRGNQYVLAIYIATFIYSLVILRQVRDDDSAAGDFVPVAAVILAVAFGLICIGALIYFIHHASTLLQASTIIERAHRELLENLDRIYPESVGQPASETERNRESVREPLTMTGTVVTAENDSGYLQMINHNIVAKMLPDGGTALIHARVGDYVTRGTPLVEVSELPDDADDEQLDQLRGAFLLLGERTLEQDVMFGIRQLVDIALKALSPSVNDPTTAEQAISCLGDALTRLARRDLPRQRRMVLQETGDNGEVKQLTLWFSEPDFEDFVGEAFNQIRLAADGEVHVLVHLLTVLGAIGRAASGKNADTLREQVEVILWQAEQLELSPFDRRRINEQAGLTARLIGAGSAH